MAPRRGAIVVMDAQQQTIALTGAGIVECRLNPRSPTLRIRGCTYCHAAPIGKPSGKCRIKGEHLCGNKCAHRRRTTGNLDWHVCIRPTSYVFRRAFSPYRHAACAWLVAVYVAYPDLLAHSVFPHSERGGSPCPGLAWIYGSIGPVPNPGPSSTFFGFWCLKRRQKDARID